MCYRHIIQVSTSCSLEISSLVFTKLLHQIALTGNGSSSSSICPNNCEQHPLNAVPISPRKLDLESRNLSIELNSTNEGHDNGMFRHAIGERRFACEPNSEMMLI